MALEMRNGEQNGMDTQALYRRVFSACDRFYCEFGQRLGATIAAPREREVQVVFFTFGTLMLAAGMSEVAWAQLYGVESDYRPFNDRRVAQAVVILLTFLEGAFGALIMAAAGIGAIISSAFGQYRASLGCLIVAVGSFILQSFLSTFFNDASIQQLRKS